MATGGAAAVAAAVARARRQVEEHFSEAGAFDPMHAVGYDPPDHLHARQFEMLVGRGIVRETGEGRYWVDRDAMRVENQRRMAALRIVFVIIIAGLVAALALSFILSR